MRSTPANHQFPSSSPFPKKMDSPTQVPAFLPWSLLTERKILKISELKKNKGSSHKNPGSMGIVYCLLIQLHKFTWKGLTRLGTPSHWREVGLIYCWFRFSWFSICANLSSKGCALEDSCVFPKWQLSHCLFPSCHMHCGLHTVEQLFVWRRTAPDFEAEHVLSTI